MTLFNADWSNCMTCPATALQKASHYKKPDILPTTDDLLKLKEHTERRLDEMPLARLLLFNKCRAGKSAKMLLLQFLYIPKWRESSNKGLINNLQPLEKEKRMDLVLVPGKRNPRVPVLITPEVGNAMELLVKTRNQCGFPPNNIYFFAVDSAAGHLDAWLVMRHVIPCKQCHNNTRRLLPFLASLCQQPSTELLCTRQMCGKHGFSHTTPAACFEELSDCNYALELQDDEDTHDNDDSGWF